MEKKEVTELKRRLKKESCTITKLAGCYVNAAKEKVCAFREDFLNLEDEEFFKYLEIASKTLSGTFGNNLMELAFPNEEDKQGAQDSLLGLRNSRLESDAVNDAFFDSVIKSYDFTGNYLILLFYDNYDVPMRGADHMKLDESEEVYEYILCAICPVKLTKAALGYHEDENRIAPRIRDWAVDAPESGFLYPAFTERSSDIHHVLLYTKNAKDPHKEFWENGLGCPSKLTATEKKNAFNHMIVNAVGAENEKLTDILADVNQNLSDFIENEKEVYGEKTPVVLTVKDVTDIVSDAGVADTKAEHIAQTYEEFFRGEDLPLANEVLDDKVIKNNELRREKNILKEQVTSLTKQLEQASLTKPSEQTPDKEEEKNADIILSVSSEKAKEITASVVDGKKCILIPLDENERTAVNGEVREL